MILFTNFPCGCCGVPFTFLATPGDPVDPEKLDQLLLARGVKLMCPKCASHENIKCLRCDSYRGPG